MLPQPRSSKKTKPSKRLSAPPKSLTQQLQTANTSTNQSNGNNNIGSIPEQSNTNNNDGGDLLDLFSDFGTTSNNAV
eukprot:CAMPEP_0202686884 /NCGR_PEP_ID=MMETSP1385-20130828/2647_1 /ASSEMBLY_ACC=CAM_ASM_000861 /TAXON_ID=933848 /ORGANISM="Elphidium margaritaceum" /LENGTH=76 /DNA_ID=CAMNT_0049341557 /DNA_START=51 /DNA_END=277 /DNA_ORIENTATION=-